MVIIIMGVAGSGKTIVGSLLADRFHLPFYEGDDHHPPANVRKMSRGIPLNDEDRLPWLHRLREIIADCRRRGQDAVLTCSALKAAYRDLLSFGDVRFVYLKATADLVRGRFAARTGHFMSPALIDSQFADLEEPLEALTVDASLPPEAIVARIASHLDLT